MSVPNEQDHQWSLLHLAIIHGWFQGQDDIMAAFLHSDLNEVIYIRQPEGFDNGTDHVAQLLQSLYGLKQAA